MQKKQTPHAFKQLTKPIQNAITEMGFTKPTLPQKLAFKPILAGENVLLVAPTGTGKTEAVLLPIFNKLVEHKPQQPKGIQVLYITPLRALNRDMLKRLEVWSQKLNITVEVRHGDTETKTRRKQAKQPPQLLVTTPETLQAILPGSQMRRHLASVQFVVVDEVHDLAESKRGVQLSLALERLLEVTGREFQRIGLSATVGNPTEVAQFVAGTNRKIRVIQATLAKGYHYQVEHPTPVEADFELAGKLQTSPEAAARIRRLTELINSHKATLIFVNSRTVAEMLGHRFNQLSREDVAVHHGSLSKEERVRIEDAFKAGGLKALICTSTLELGIDVGQVDLVVQYMSPRQVSSLIQRVGRSGHRLEQVSEGVVLTVYSDDTLESIAAVENAQKGKLEPVLMHEGALDVLAHQICGVLMDKQTTPLTDLTKLIHQAYLYRNLTEKQLFDVVDFLASLHKLRLEQEGKLLRKTGRTREYYYSNLSMIPDERRYPVINILNDHRIGTLGDEFMALDARVGLHFIMRGKVWRIVQIEEESGTVHVVPAEDPFAAIPGWDGEMLPVPYGLAQQTGAEREEIGNLLKQGKTPEQAAAEMATKLKIDPTALQETTQEISEHLQEGAPLPTQNRVVLETYDRYLVVHACFGENVNKTLGGVFDATLSERELVTGWWADGYHILLELPRKLSRPELQELPQTLFHLTEKQVDEAFLKYLNGKFPFAARMKAIAERFGALPRGKTMSYERQAKLKASFEDTPIYDETLREGMLEKADLKRAKQVIRMVQEDKITVASVARTEKPTPLAYHILEQYADVSELMAPERVILSNIEKMKNATEARMTTLLCMHCGQWMLQERVKNLPNEPECQNCHSHLLTVLYPSQDAQKLKTDLQKRREGKELSPEELKELATARRKADLILSYGKQAVRALQIKGVGPENASRILGKMHPNQDEFYMDLLKAKIQYLRTHGFWETQSSKQ